MTARVEITLLTQTSCGMCELAKGILARLGNEYPLSVTEVDLRSEQGRRLAAEAGVLFAPGILVDGQPSPTDGSPNENFDAPSIAAP